jgi:hypothetical protein
MARATRTNGTEFTFKLEDITAVADYASESEQPIAVVYGVRDEPTYIAETPERFLHRLGIGKAFVSLTRPDGSSVWVGRDSVDQIYSSDSPEKKRKLRRRSTFGDLVALVRNFQTLTIGTVLLTFGIFFSEFLMSGKKYSILWSPLTYAALFREFGFACIIAFVISMAIERVARREFSETINQRLLDVQKAVFRAIYFRDLTPQLVSEVETLIFNADFMRHNHRQAYTLSLTNARELDPTNPLVPDYPIMQCDVTMSYEVRNISREEKDFLVRIELEKAYPEFLNKFVRIKGVKINGVDMLRVEIDKCDTDCPDTEDFRCFEKIVRNIQPGDRVKVNAVWQVLKDPDDSEVWRSIYPSDGMTLGVNFPKAVRLKGAHALHRQIISSKGIEGASYYEWSIEKAVLPHQGIVFWWRSSAEPKLLDPPLEPSEGTSSPLES